VHLCMGCSAGDGLLKSLFLAMLKDMKLIRNYLSKKNIFQPKALDDQTVFYVFRKVIKDEFGNVGIENLIPDYYNNKTIFVKSDSSVWKSEIWLNRERIVRKMNVELGAGTIEKIKVK